MMQLRSGIPWLGVLMVYAHWSLTPIQAGVIEGRISIPAEAFPEVSAAIVSVEQGRPAPDPQAAPAIVDQKGLQFIPRVQAMQWGGDIVVRNSDRELHNVHCQNRLIGFNVGLGPQREFRLAGADIRRPGVLPLLCNIHHHMRGYVVVVAGPHFCQSDARGNFRLGGVPAGPAELHVWQESCEPLHRKIVVGDGVLRLDLTLSLKPGLKNALLAVATPAVPWGEVVDRIDRCLRRAVHLAAQQDPDAAQRRPPDASAAAESSLSEALDCYFDAYFEHFEAAELEPAIGRYISGRRRYELEARFDEVRRQLGPLAEGRTSQADVERLIESLRAALSQDVAKLHKLGMYDKTALVVKDLQNTATGEVISSQAGPGGARGVVSQANVQVVLRDLLADFRKVAELLKASQPRSAAILLGQAYFERFHLIEPQLMAQDALGTTRLEGEFSRLRGLAARGRTADVEQGLLSLYRDIEQAARPRSLWSVAVNALIIVLREGLEAILIVTALVTYLLKMGQARHLRSVYWGVGLALVASVATWAGLQWFISNAGFNQELIEGIVALLAAGVLFYVSYWLISKAEAQRWQHYLSDRVKRGLAAGSGWAMGTTAFLAVYREGAETILMFQPIAGSGPSGWLIIAGALGVGGVLLAGVFWLMRSLGMRLPLRAFFQGTGALLFALAVIFAGKGTAELQEAGVLRITPLAGLPALPDLGLYPNLQTLLVQGVLLAGALAGLLTLWLDAARAGRAAVEPAAAPPHHPRPHKEHEQDGKPVAVPASLVDRERAKV